MPEENRRLSGRDHRPETSLRYKAAPFAFTPLLFSASFIRQFYFRHLKVRWQLPLPPSILQWCSFGALRFCSNYIFCAITEVFGCSGTLQCLQTHYSPSCHLTELWSHRGTKVMETMMQSAQCYRHAGFIHICVCLYSPACFYACPFVYALLLCCVPICVPCVHGAKCWQSPGLAAPLIPSLRSPLSPVGLEICNHVCVPACQLANAKTLSTRQTGPNLQTLIRRRRLITVINMFRFFAHCSYSM